MTEKWTPFERANQFRLPDPVEVAKAVSVPVEMVLKEHERILKRKTYVNSLYTVIVDLIPAIPGWQEMFWLSIRRNDRAMIRDWRDLQRIKNEIVGEENEGVELFPSESRKVDTSNQYHMYVLTDPKIRFPFGFDHRMVIDHDPKMESVVGHKQRPMGE